jgi:hypothetical protein
MDVFLGIISVLGLLAGILTVVICGSANLSLQHGRAEGFVSNERLMLLGMAIMIVSVILMLIAIKLGFGDDVIKFLNGFTSLSVEA